MHMGGVRQAARCPYGAAEPSWAMVRCYSSSHPPILYTACVGFYNLSHVIRAAVYSHFWLLLHEYTLLYMYLYMYIDIQHIQYTDSMAPSFVKFCQVYHAFARTHTSVYFGPILLLHEYTLHSYTTKYTLHYVYSHPGTRYLEVQYM